MKVLLFSLREGLPRCKPTKKINPYTHKLTKFIETASSFFLTYDVIIFMIFGIYDSHYNLHLKKSSFSVTSIHTHTRAPYSSDDVIYSLNYVIKISLPVFRSLPHEILPLQLTVHDPLLKMKRFDWSTNQTSVFRRHSLVCPMFKRKNKNVTFTLCVVITS